MSDAEPSLHDLLTTGRAKVERQIDLLHGRLYPYADLGLVGSLLMLVSGGFGPPFRTNFVMCDNTDLIARLTDLLQRIDDALEELGSHD